MVKDRVEGLAWLRKQLETADVDLLREMVRAMAATLMEAEADSLCGAAYGQSGPERVNQRNGYRDRRWDTRVGIIELAIPRLRKDSYYPEWLLDPRRRSERSLVQVVTECYVREVSTRRLEGLVQALGLTGVSKSQVSEMAKGLDEVVDGFRNRPLDQGPYSFLWLDAISQRCREGGRVVNVATVIATAVNTQGKREVLGVEVVTNEDGAGGTAFLRGLVARGLSGVKLAISDDHLGLKAALASVFTGAAWQRCRTHFTRNLLTRVPKSAQDLVATLVRSIFAQPDADEVWAQHGRVVEQLEKRFGAAAKLLAEAAEDILAFSAFPKAVWRQVWSNNPQERLNREIRRRTDVVGIFPNRPAIIRLVGAVQAEHNDEWVVVRRYRSAEALDQAQAGRQELKEEIKPVKQLAA